MSLEAHDKEPYIPELAAQDYAEIVKDLRTSSDFPGDIEKLADLLSDIPVTNHYRSALISRVRHWAQSAPVAYQKHLKDLGVVFEEGRLGVFDPTESRLAEQGALVALYPGYLGTQGSRDSKARELASFYESWMEEFKNRYGVSSARVDPSAIERLDQTNLFQNDTLHAPIPLFPVPKLLPPAKS